MTNNIIIDAILVEIQISVNIKETNPDGLGGGRDIRRGIRKSRGKFIAAKSSSLTLGKFLRLVVAQVPTRSSVTTSTTSIVFAFNSRVSSNRD